MTNIGGIVMEDDEIRNTYADLVKQLASGGRLTSSGKEYVETINQIFRVTGEDSLLFQGVVGVISKERFGNTPTEEQIASVTTSLRGFLKSAGSPFSTWKDGRKLMIKTK